MSGYPTPPYQPGGSTPLDTVLHSTMTKSRKKLIMASVKSNALQAWAFATGRVEYEDGGHEITNPLTVGRNPNVASYEYYDALPMAQTSEFETVRYNWSRVGGSVIISDQEQDENRGSAQIFKLLRAKMEVLEESIKEKFSGYLYGAGAGTDPLGLAALIPDAALSALSLIAFACDTIIMPESALLGLPQDSSEPHIDGREAAAWVADNGMQPIASNRVELSTMIFDEDTISSGPIVSCPRWSSTRSSNG